MLFELPIKIRRSFNNQINEIYRSVCRPVVEFISGGIRFCSTGKRTTNQQTITVILEPLALVRFVNFHNCVCSPAVYAKLKNKGILSIQETSTDCGVFAYMVSCLVFQD